MFIIQPRYLVLCQVLINAIFNSQMPYTDNNQNLLMQAIRANGVNNFNLNPETRVVDPKNLLAIDRVRCNNCSQYFPLTEINNHLKTHQIYNGALTDPNRILSRLPGVHGGSIAPIDMDHDAGYRSQRIKTSNYLPQSSIDIQTMIPQELPTPDIIRRKIPLPVPGSSLQNDVGNWKDNTRVTGPGSTVSDLSATKPDGIPGLQIRNSEIPEIADPVVLEEEYYEKVSVGKTRLEINPKTIPVYSNQNTYGTDSHIEKKKQPIMASGTKSNSKQWKVEPADINLRRPPRPNDTGDLLDSTRPLPDNSTGIASGPERKTYMVEDKGKLGVEDKNRRIDTRTNVIKPISQIGGRPRDSRREQEIGNNRTSSKPNGSAGICGGINICPGVDRDHSPEVTIDPTMHTHHGSKGGDFSCPACGGFYCPVCKSTVPPQFRPPPGYKEYLEHSRSTHFMNTPSRD